PRPVCVRYPNSVSPQRHRVHRELFKMIFSSPRPQRLGGECPSCFSPRRRRGSQRDLLLQRRNRMMSIQHLQRSTKASTTRENFAPVALPEVREKWSTSTDATR